MMFTPVSMLTGAGPDEKGVMPHFWCLSFLAEKTFLIAVPG
jgi:hypothetical protein